MPSWRYICCRLLLNRAAQDSAPAAEVQLPVTVQAPLGEDRFTVSSRVAAAGCRLTSSISSAACWLCSRLSGGAMLKLCAERRSTSHRSVLRGNCLSRTMHYKTDAPSTHWCPLPVGLLEVLQKVAAEVQLDTCHGKIQCLRYDMQKTSRSCGKLVCLLLPGCQEHTACQSHPTSNRAHPTASS